MKFLRLIPALLLLSSVSTLAIAEEIKGKQEFIELVSDKKLVLDNSWVRILRNGTVEGKGPDQGDITGTWEWKGRYYCRDIVIDGETLPPDCQTVTIEGNIVTFTHKEGSGISVSWAMD